MAQVNILADQKNVLFLASGRGSNFQAFVDHLRLGVLKEVSIKALICNRPGAPVVQRAREAEVPVFEIEGIAGKKFEPKEKRELARLAFDNECISISKLYEIDYVILAGFDQVLTKSFVDNFPFRILNIHPAYDLQLFGGSNMVGSKVHESVIASGARYSGCSVHLVTSAVDQGPIISKKRVSVLHGDTADSLAARILEQEHLVYPEAVQLLVDGRVIVSDSGARCYVDRYSGRWDLEWEERQQSYIDFFTEEKRGRTDH